MADLKWVNIDIATLAPVARKAFDAYKAQYKLASDLRKTFEATMISVADMGHDRTLRFGYRFGKLSIAIDKADEISKPERTAGLSLADYLKTVSTR